ncbi:uncharacterized protein LOC126198835 [Schistocerca nitens]|uniref:uncharacterized protein LOC126198835 n=1 Tax=Schistocerca nitens TaxID=7011 RepID=UPI002119A3CF|nr:uncharacterized protein LOC126198835 [Schistocerca nitens]
MASKTLFLAAVVVVSCVDASWLPWTPQLQVRNEEAGEVPGNDFNIHHFNASTICLRLSTAISIQLQYTTADNQDGTLQVVVPRLTEDNLEGSCGPDAFINVSWTPEATTESPATTPAAEEPTALRVEETWWYQATASDVNSLRFDFVQQNDSYFLANIKGVINIVDAPEDFPADSAVVELSVSNQILFKAPLGVVSMCYGTTVLEADIVGNVTAANITMTDVQLLAYYEDSFWPNKVTSCNPSSAAPKLDSTVSFALGMVGALLVNTLMW